MLAQTTQPLTNLWTPGEVYTLITIVSTVFVGAIVTGVIKIIEAARNSKLAVIAATKAQTTADNNKDRIESVQQQVTAVAIATNPAPLAPVTFEQAELLRQSSTVTPPKGGE